MINYIKAQIAHRMGFITPEEHVTLMRKALTGLQTTLKHSAMLHEQERAVLHAQVKHLREMLRAAEAEIAFAKARIRGVRHVSHPKVVTTDDF